MTKNSNEASNQGHLIKFVGCLVSFVVQLALISAFGISMFLVVLAFLLLVLLSPFVILPYFVFPIFASADAALPGGLSFLIGDLVALALGAILLTLLTWLFQLLGESGVIGSFGGSIAYTVLFLECLMALVCQTHLGLLGLAKQIGLWLLMGVLFHDFTSTALAPVLSRYRQTSWFSVGAITAGIIGERVLPKAWSITRPIRKDIDQTVSRVIVRTQRSRIGEFCGLDDLLGEYESPGQWEGLGSEASGQRNETLIERMASEVRRQRKETLIERVGSRFRPVAMRSIDKLRREGWLSDGSLQDADLRDANLERANLRGAYLKHAKLRGATFERADLRDANLERTWLQDTNLEGADLRGASLARAGMIAANLAGAYLGGANLERANLRGANLEGAHLEGVNLEGAVLATSRGVTVGQLGQARSLGGAILPGDTTRLSRDNWQAEFEEWCKKQEEQDEAECDDDDDDDGDD